MYIIITLNRHVNISIHAIDVILHTNNHNSPYWCHYVYIYLYIYIYVYVCIYVCIYASACVYIYMHLHTYMRIYIYYKIIYIYICTHTSPAYSKKHAVILNSVRASCSVPSAKAWCCFPWPTTPEFRKDHWGIKQQLMNVYIWFVISKFITKFITRHQQLMVDVSVFRRCCKPICTLYVTVRVPCTISIQCFKKKHLYKSF